jgi:2-methylcitrate dehydratase PrpD
MADLSKYGKAVLDFAMTKANPKTDFYREAFLNWYGCVLAGFNTRMVEIAVQTFREEGTSSALPPVGRKEHLDIPKAVQIDCLSSACLAYDDIHFETTLHPAGPVAAAILGVARTRKVSGKDALCAFQAGFEVECRTALGLTNKNNPTAKCWYPTGIAGGMGAAVAAGQLLDLSREQMESAIGLAAGYASGTRGTHGGMSGSWVPGIAAEAGYISAKMAKNGFTAPISSLVGVNGLFNAINPDAPYEEVFKGLGDTYVCETTACKPFPFGFISFAVIQCCIDAAEKLKQAGKAFDKVELYVSPTSYTLGKNPTPANVYQAMVCLRYIAARVLSDPDEAFVPLDDSFTIPENIGKCMERITIHEKDSLRNDQAEIHLILEDGSSMDVSCDVAPGAPGNPITTEQVDKKFLLQAGKALNGDAAKFLLDYLKRLEEADDISVLIKYPGEILGLAKES